MRHRFPKIISMNSCINMALTVQAISHYLGDGFFPLSHRVVIGKTVQCFPYTRH
jgi:hypothetical protein